jgi:hypothetical protein
VPTSPTLGGAGGTLLFLMLACWLIQLGFLFSVVGQQVHGHEVVGQAFGWLGAMILAGFAWLWLGGLLLKAGVQDILPQRIDMVALILYIGAGGAIAAAFTLLQDGSRVWPAAVPVVVPPILAFYVFALHRPSMRDFFASMNGTLAVWIPVLILTLAPWPSLVRELRGIAEQQAAMRQGNAQELERKRAENLPKLQAMGADAPVWDWLDLLDESSGVHAEALEAVRKLERRQGDVEDMLGWGIPRAMQLLSDLDLKATPKLCESANAYLRKEAKETRVRAKQDPREYRGEGYVERSLPAIRWMMANGCDCDATVEAIQKSVETYIDTRERKAALAALAELRKK